MTTRWWFVELSRVNDFPVEIGGATNYYYFWLDDDTQQQQIDKRGCPVQFSSTPPALRAAAKM